MDKRFRKAGLGRALLAAKISILKWQYPGTVLTTFAAKSNVGSVKICEANQLYVIADVARSDEDGKDSGYLRFSTVREHDTSIESIVRDV